jgi:hypothetical protein
LVNDRQSLLCAHALSVVQQDCARHESHAPACTESPSVQLEGDPEPEELEPEGTPHDPSCATWLLHEGASRVPDEQVRSLAFCRQSMTASFSAAQPAGICLRSLSHAETHESTSA